MVRNLIIISAMLLGSLVCAQGVDGIYQLEIENDSGLIISRGTGFLVQSKSNNKPYVLTSFHLVNARLLDADRVRIKITTGGSKYLKIVAYDELNDMLALSSEGLNDQALNMSNLCSGDLNVAGYHGEKLIDLNIKGASTINKGVSKLPIYLTKGFSGAPVMNVNADVCGMVVLSSEQNASSVAVSYNMINNFLDSIDQSTKAFSVRELRLLMGIEENVTTQDE
ncbi:MAG: hypothetical protein NTY22_02920 [Proteobacteria bacterium]|nr:hypothetical protein [Pseudomonadota bacterium]